GARGAPGAQLLREIGHPGEGVGAALVEPVHQLARPEGLAAELLHERLEVRARESEKVRALGGGGGVGDGGGGHGGECAPQTRGCSSVTLKKYAISRAAVSGASEPCTMFSSILA